MSLGIWIGVYHKVGKLISYWKLTYTGHVLLATTFPILTNSDMKTKDYKRRLINYDSKVKAIIDIANMDLTE